ncbi:helix-turn-helix domain-containing protein [Afifella aestuarii]|uniref:helix-turn-helix domain-containing protein n=1 Tax=Afifella aestuarii TaxID=1909496 RepID=UPI000FE32848|nr:helix-turn-helix domain-containing protein [Afifella aestuarii]
MEHASKRYLTPAELSARYGGRINPRTLANWRSAGQGPSYLKLGGAVVYPIAKVEEWEERNTVSGTGEYCGNP